MRENLELILLGTWLISFPDVTYLFFFIIAKGTRERLHLYTALSSKPQSQIIHCWITM